MGLRVTKFPKPPEWRKNASEDNAISSAPDGTRLVAPRLSSDESLVSHQASRQEPLREVAGAAFGFSFFFFLISFF